jgi:(p)ppGpp synthase/HD superfamily hydrolase
MVVSESGVDAKLVEAAEFAARCHEEQRRRDGKRYITHPASVAERVRRCGGSDLQVLVAWLHDTVEDASEPGWVLGEIRARFGGEVAALVDVLTHRKGESYADYVLRVAGCEDALLVKVCDMVDNLRCKPSQMQEDKYTMALVSMIRSGVGE